MSYYVTITRNPSPHWQSGRIISEAEWREVALAEPGIRMPIDSEEGDAADLFWAGHPESSEVFLTWFDGQIDARNPDKFTLALMARLAVKLNANLIGEEGERFDISGKSLGVFVLPEEPGTKPRWWQRIVENLGALWPGRRKPPLKFRYRTARWR